MFSSSTKRLPKSARRASVAPEMICSNGLNGLNAPGGMPVSAMVGVFGGATRPASGGHHIAAQLKIVGTRVRAQKWRAIGVAPVAIEHRVTVIEKDVAGDTCFVVARAEKNVAAILARVFIQRVAIIQGELGATVIFI